MIPALPPFDVLYDALLSRDESYQGRAYVCVTTTRVFCRLTCPARKPKAENCRFHPDVRACLQAGYRPCKRCTPLKPLAEADPILLRLIAALQDDPSRRWTEADLTALGHDPSTLRRIFKRHFGITFLELARLTRLRAGAATLANQGRVIDAQLDAGFTSGSGFRAAFNLLGYGGGLWRKHWLLDHECIHTQTPGASP